MCALHANSVTVMSNPLMSASTIDVFTDVKLYINALCSSAFLYVTRVNQLK